jgi:hypothetical protein
MEPWSGGSAKTGWTESVAVASRAMSPVITLTFMMSSLVMVADIV